MKDEIAYKELNQPITDAICKNAINLSFDIAELSIDTLFDNEILKEIPVVKTIVGITKGFIAVRDIFFAKKLLVFLQQLNRGESDTKEFNKFKEKMSKDNKYASKVVDHIAIILDRHISVEKSKIFANLFISYINEKIAWDMLYELSNCLDFMFLSDIDVLLIVYENSKNYKGDKENIEKMSDVAKNIKKYDISISRLNSIGLIVAQDYSNFMGELLLGTNPKITEIGIAFCKYGLENEKSITSRSLI